ncbi:MAG: endonuclease/exonuclease/phosphatase family protein [bacterium]
MPNIKIIYWNVENFGDAHDGRRGNYVPLCNFIAQVVQNVDADILCLMELKQNAVQNQGVNPLALLQQALHNLAPATHWYYDWIPGSLVFNGFGANYNPNNVNFTNQGRREGYAVFWRLNISKFIMQSAAPIDPLTTTPQGQARPMENLPNGHIINTQSNGILNNFAINLGSQYSIPLGTVPPPGGAPLPMLLNPGDIIPQNTQIGPTGIQLNQLINGVNPIVVPGGYTLTDNLILPAVNSVIVPQHILSLVLSGRTQNYNPGGINDWDLLTFPGADRAILWNGSRRPAFCTIKVNNFGNDLIPITIYHAPLSDPVQAMYHCATSRSLYEAYDYNTNQYIHNTRSIVGGDFNARLNGNALHYTAYTDDFNNNGAGCNDATVAPPNQNIRVNNNPPLAPPAFPPPPALLTPANNPQNKSTVQLKHPIIGAGNPVLSNNTEHYRRSAIDNIFYRGFTAAEAPHHAFGDIYDLLQAVTGGGLGLANFQIPPAIIQMFRLLPIFHQGNFPLPPHPGINNVLNNTTLFFDIGQGSFPQMFSPPAGNGPFAGQQPLPQIVTPARRAAEFLRVFVSDHLPVIFEMNLVPPAPPPAPPPAHPNPGDPPPSPKRRRTV